MDYLHVQADNPWYNYYIYIEKTNEYDKEMPESQTTDQTMPPRGRDPEHIQRNDSKNTIKVINNLSGSLSLSELEGTQGTTSQNKDQTHKTLAQWEQ